MYKAKDLAPAFDWKNRRILLQDGILHIPEMCDDDYAFPEWKEIFGNDHPVAIEYCSGNGDWILSKALEEPGTNWVAVEKQFRRVRKIWAKMKTHNLSNLFIVCGEAHRASRAYFPEGSVSSAYVNFPDPWPKTRHAKHRLITQSFLDQVDRILLPGAPFTFVSDDRPYVDLFAVEAEAHSAFSQVFFKTEWPNYGGSWFQTLWKKLGREICYVQYRNL